MARIITKRKVSKKLVYGFSAFLVLTLILSIPDAITVYHISEIYLSPVYRQAVYEITLSLQSEYGFLLSTIHLRDVQVIRDTGINDGRKDTRNTGRILRVSYIFTYPSTLQRCSPKSVIVEYDLSHRQIIRLTFSDKTFEDNYSGNVLEHDTICT